MFSYEQLEKYNETDVEIYRYVINNMDRVGYMSIRELAHELHVSTSTILDWSQYLRQILRDIQNRVYLPQLK